MMNDTEYILPDTFIKSIHTYFGNRILPLNSQYRKTQEMNNKSHHYLCFTIISFRYSSFIMYGTSETTSSTHLHPLTVSILSS